MKPGFWRHVDSDHDYFVTEMLCCGSRTAACADGEISAEWTFCPFCGTQLIAKHDCRTHSMPRWVWDRFRDKAYDINWRPKKKSMPYWSIESRYAEWRDRTIWHNWKEENRLWCTYRADALHEFRKFVEEQISNGYLPYSVQYRLRFGTQFFEPEWAVIHEFQYKDS